MQCFESVTDLPPVETAAGLGGPTYFFLIVAAQVAPSLSLSLFLSLSLCLSVSLSFCLCRTHFFLMGAAQVAGASAEVLLIKRLRGMGMMPPSEMAILVTALTIEILRMLLVDIFMLQQYLAPNKCLLRTVHSTMLHLYVEFVCKSVCVESVQMYICIYIVHMVYISTCT